MRSTFTKKRGGGLPTPVSAIIKAVAKGVYGEGIGITRDKKLSGNSVHDALWNDGPGNGVGGGLWVSLSRGAARVTLVVEWQSVRWKSGQLNKSEILSGVHRQQPPDEWNS